MVPMRVESARPLPPWLVAAGSLAIAFHFFAIAILVVAAPSGPWLSPFGPSQAQGPTFATLIEEYTTRRYLQPLRMSHNYHFQSNRVDVSDVYCEAVLRGEDGNIIETVRFPSKKDNPWVAYRHGLLAQALANDEPVNVPQAEQIPPPGQEVERIALWKPVKGERKSQLVEVDKNLVKDEMKDLPPGTPVMRPQPWALLLSRAYARHLCRRYGAASVQITRHSRDALSPALLFVKEENIAPNTFDDFASQFEDYRRAN